MKKAIVLLFFAMGCVAALAQANPLDTVSEAKLMRKAVRYRIGINCNVNTKKAANIYKYLVRKGNTRAMYELGKMYLNGDGVEQNYKAAYNLFSKSAKEGQIKAFCKMAFMHQKGLGRPVNVRNAYLLYKRAADAGNVQGYYGTGYLLYKGLGVKQNYDKAIEYLKKGAERNHAGCSFLLGAYYASGYNGIPDYDKAADFFNRASKAGHGWTIDITKLGVLDSLKKHFSISADHWTDVRNRIISAAKMRSVCNNTDLHALEGTWTGRVYTYDWSKTKIIGQKDVRLDFEPAGDSVAVKWYENDTLMTTFTPVRTSKGWKEYTLKEYQKDNEFVITNAKFEKDQQRLFASFRQFGIKNNEYRKPVLAVLTRQGDIEADNMAGGFLLKKVSFVSGGNLSVTVTADNPQTVDVSLCSIFGTVIRKLGEVSLANGENKFNFDISLPKGIYVVKVTGKDCAHSKTVTLK